MTPNWEVEPSWPSLVPLSFQQGRHGAGQIPAGSMRLASSRKGEMAAKCKSSASGPLSMLTSPWSGSWPAGPPFLCSAIGSLLTCGKQDPGTPSSGAMSALCIGVGPQGSCLDSQPAAQGALHSPRWWLPLPTPGPSRHSPPALVAPPRGQACSTSVPHCRGQGPERKTG